MPLPSRRHTPLPMRSYLRLWRSQPEFLTFGVLLCASASFGQTWFVSLFGGDIRAEFDLTHGDFGAIYSLATLASAVTLVWVGRLIDRVPLLTFSCCVFAGLAVASFGVFQATHFMVVAVAMFGLRLCGQGLMTHIAVTSMARYFDADRGKAISVATLGFPLAESVLPLTVVMVTASLGWRDAWLLWSVAVAGLLLPLSVWLLQRSRALWDVSQLVDHRPAMVEKNEASEQGSNDSSELVGATESETAIDTSPRSWTRAEVLADPRFRLMLPYLLAPAFISTGIMFHQVHLVDTKGWTLEWFASGFIAYGIAKVVASLIGGPLVDRYSARVLFPTFLLPMGLGVLLLAVSDSPFVGVAFLALSGVTNGLGGPIGGAFWAEVYGTQHLGAIRALAVSIMVLGSALSPVMFGWLFDLGATFSLALYGCCIIAVVSTALAALAMRSSTAPR